MGAGYILSYVGVLGIFFILVGFSIMLLTMTPLPITREKALQVDKVNERWRWNFFGRGLFCSGLIICFGVAFIQYWPLM